MNDSSSTPPACVALWLDRIMAAGLLVWGFLWVAIGRLVLGFYQSEDTAEHKLFFRG